MNVFIPNNVDHILLASIVLAILVALVNKGIMVMEGQEQVVAYRTTILLNSPS